MMTMLPLMKPAAIPSYELSVKKRLLSSNDSKGHPSFRCRRRGYYVVLTVSRGRCEKVGPRHKYNVNSSKCILTFEFQRTLIISSHNVGVCHLDLVYCIYKEMM